MCEFLAFPGQSGVLNKNHENGFRPLPFHLDKGTGKWTIKIKMSEEEMQFVQDNGGEFWFEIMSGPRFYPILPRFETLDFEANFDECVVPYERDDEHEVLWVWVAPGTGLPLPDDLFVAGRTYRRTGKWEPIKQANAALDIGAMYLRKPVGEEGQIRGLELLKYIDDMPSIANENRATVRQEILKNSLIWPVLVRKGQGGTETIIC